MKLKNDGELDQNVPKTKIEQERHMGKILMALGWVLLAPTVSTFGGIDALQIWLVMTIVFMIGVGFLMWISNSA